LIKLEGIIKDHIK